MVSRLGYTLPKIEKKPDINNDGYKNFSFVNQGNSIVNIKK